MRGNGESASTAFLKPCRAELLVWVWARRVNITMSHNPLLLCSTRGILTQKCQRSQSGFIRIPHTCFSVVILKYIAANHIHMHTHSAKTHIYEWGDAFITLVKHALQILCLQSSFRKAKLISPFFCNLVVIQIIHFMLYCPVSKTVVRKF